MDRSAQLEADVLARGPGERWVDLGHDPALVAVVIDDQVDEHL